LSLFDFEGEPRSESCAVFWLSVIPVIAGLYADDACMGLVPEILRDKGSSFRHLRPPVQSNPLLLWICCTTQQIEMSGVLALVTIVGVFLIDGCQGGFTKVF